MVRVFPPWDPSPKSVTVTASCARPPPAGGRPDSSLQQLDPRALFPTARPLLPMASFPTVRSNQPTGSMGTSARFGVPKSARLTPGPGAYCGNGITASQYPSSPSAPWPAIPSARVLRKSTSSEYIAPRSSFGAQSTSVRSSAPSASFGTARRLPVHGNNVPGPGAYEFSSSFARSAEKRDGNGSAFGGSQDLGRLATWAALPQEEQTPGPHQAGPESCGGGHILSDWHNAPSFSFLGSSCDRRVHLDHTGQAGRWRSQGIMGRCAAAPLALPPSYRHPSAPPPSPPPMHPPRRALRAPRAGCRSDRSRTTYPRVATSSARCHAHPLTRRPEEPLAHMLAALWMAAPDE